MDEQSKSNRAAPRPEHLNEGHRAVQMRDGPDWGCLLFLLGGMVAMYLLSTGPVAKLYQATGEPKWLEKTIDVVYAPVEALYHASPAFENVMDLYIENVWRAR